MGVTPPPEAAPPSWAVAPVGFWSLLFSGPNTGGWLRLGGRISAVGNPSVVASLVTLAQGDALRWRPLAVATSAGVFPRGVALSLCRRRGSLSVGLPPGVIFSRQAQKGPPLQRTPPGCLLPPGKFYGFLLPGGPLCCPYARGGPPLGDPLPRSPGEAPPWTLSWRPRKVNEGRFPGETPGSRAS